MGAGGLDQSLTVGYANNILAGSATASASYPGDLNHDPSSDTGSFEILTGFRVVGFFPPVDMTPYLGTHYLNSIKGGQTVPLKFRAYSITPANTLGAEITSTVGISIVVKTLTSCDGGIVDADVLPATTGGTSFRYTDGQFIFNWATPKTANKCYRVYVQTADGSTTMFASTLTSANAQEAWFKSK